MSLKPRIALPSIALLALGFAVMTPASANPLAGVGPAGIARAASEAGAPVTFARFRGAYGFRGYRGHGFYGGPRFYGRSFGYSRFHGGYGGFRGNFRGGFFADRFGNAPVFLNRSRDIFRGQSN